jgi:hypothetical protein
LLRDITVARIFWLSQSEERKNSAKPKKWPSMIRNVSIVNGQTDRLALPYRYKYLISYIIMLLRLGNNLGQPSAVYFAEKENGNFGGNFKMAPGRAGIALMEYVERVSDFVK